MLTINRLSAAMLLTLTGSLIVSLFFKDQHLWMDEVLSYLLLSDPSLAHANRAIVSGMDANPPLFINLYWLIGHAVSLNSIFLKSLSILLFAGTVVWFFRYTTRLLDQNSSVQQTTGTLRSRTAVINFLVILIALSLTYLNYTLSTQIRTYSLYLLLGWGYIVTLHQLMLHPHNRRWLVALAVVGILFLYTHNVALFYIAGAGSFFGLLWLTDWFRRREMRYFPVVGVHLLMALVWLITWFPSFSIQAQSGVPHSWIPVPTFLTFFKTIGDLIPNVSAHLEVAHPLLMVARVLVVTVLFGWIVGAQLRTHGRAALANPAFAFYVLAGFLIGFTFSLGLAVSLVHTSVFLNRYFWPSSLLLLYQLIYAGWWLRDRVFPQAWSTSRIKLPAFSPLLRSLVLGSFLALIGLFIAYQNRKIPLFSGAISHDIAKLKPGQPVLLESAYYFLPIRFYQSRQPIYYLLDWPTALDTRNVLESTTDYKILEGVADNYRLSGLIRPRQFNPAHFNHHFYVVDEASRYQIEAFIARGQVKVHQIIPTGVAGHKILDCSF
ncbi:hypothetical protein [Fibrella arboris]|uniref:hypothetical protein n=1 Tax=Fibrella arboris TaxID=3242486 RepID=UPI003520930F